MLFSLRTTHCFGFDVRSWYVGIGGMTSYGEIAKKEYNIVNLVQPLYTFISSPEARTQRWMSL